MNITHKTLAVFFIVALSSLFTSCQKEDVTPKPVISNLELGIGDNHTAYIGADLHIEAEIVAEGKIDKVTVEIHQEEGSDDEIVVEYDDFEGLKNTTFHQHIDIPETTVAGEYHCHIIVTDMEGNSTTVEDEISIKELVDEEAPVLEITTAPTNGQSFTTGETISISGSVTDNISLEGIFIALVRESDNMTDADVDDESSSVILMLHTHDFGDDPDEYEFSSSIAVGAINDNNITPAPIEGDNAWQSGNYYILIKSKDAMGNWVISAHYPIEINL